MKIIVNNEKRLEEAIQQKLTLKIEEKIVRFEKIVPEIKETIINMADYKPSESTKTIDEREAENLRKIMKQDVRKEFQQRLRELKDNILAYQELLMTKEKTIRLQADQLSQFRASSLEDRYKTLLIEIDELKGLLLQKEKELEMIRSDTAKCKAC